MIERIRGSWSRRRIGGGRRRGRPRRARAAPGVQRWASDAALLVALLCILAGILLALAARQPARVWFALGAEPTGVLLDGFYGAERATGAPYRWAKPRAAISVPIDGPALYRVTLVMQDAPSAPSQREVGIRVNGEPMSPIALSSAPRDYTLLYRIKPQWGTTRDLTRLEVTLSTTAFVPPGDNRSLGPLVASMRVEPVAAPGPWRPDVLLPNALLLAVLYLALRFAGASTTLTALTAAAFVSGLGLLALVLPVTALLLAYEAVNYTWGFAGTLVALAVLPVIARFPGPEERHSSPREPGSASGGSAACDYDTKATRPRLLTREGLLWSVGVFAVLRVGFSLVALGLATFTRLPPPCDFERTAGLWAALPPLHERGAAFRWLGVWQRWDACWYAHIATSGYLPGESSTAFFPLYPLLARLAGGLVGGGPTLGGLLVSSLAFIAAGVGIYRLVGTDFGRGTARRALVYLAIFPVSFFFFAPFTEALFFASAVWSLGAARRGQWALAATAGLLAGLTRAQGSLLFLPVAWEVARQWRSGGVTGGKHPKWAILAPLAPPLGLIAFALYGNVVVGASPFQAQATWRYTLHAPWTVVQLSWHYLRARGDAIEAFNLACFASAALILARGARRLPASYTLYAAPQLLVIGTRVNFSPLMATSRYVLVLFPLFVILALGAGAHAWRPRWMIGSVLLLLVFVTAFITGTFVA